MPLYKNETIQIWYFNCLVSECIIHTEAHLVRFFPFSSSVILYQGFSSSKEMPVPEMQSSCIPWLDTTNNPMIYLHKLQTRSIGRFKSQDILQCHSIVTSFLNKTWSRFFQFSETIFNLFSQPAIWKNRGFIALASINLLLSLAKNTSYKNSAKRRRHPAGRIFFVYCK